MESEPDDAARCKLGNRFELLAIKRSLLLVCLVLLCGGSVHDDDRDAVANVGCEWRGGLDAAADAGLWIEWIGIEGSHPSNAPALAFLVITAHEHPRRGLEQQPGRREEIRTP